MNLVSETTLICHKISSNIVHDREHFWFGFTHHLRSSDFEAFKFSYIDDSIFLTYSPLTMAERLTLWNQVEGLEGPLGPRLSGEPEIVHETEDYMRKLGVPISRVQIEMILRNVPSVFPEDWQDPGTFSQLSDEQKKVGYEITEANPVVPIYGAQVQKVIEFGVSYRNQFSRGKD